MNADPVPHESARPRPSRAVTPPQRLEQPSGAPEVAPGRAKRSTAHTRPYRVLVTGSRTWANPELVRRQLMRCWLAVDRPLVVVHGACPTGADRIAADWAAEMRQVGFPIDDEPHRAQDHPTQDFGRWPAAGPRRNAYMVELGADMCLAFIGPCTKRHCPGPRPHGSHGATGCADMAEAAGIPTRRWTT